MPFINTGGLPVRNPRVKPAIEPDLQTVSIPGLNPGIPASRDWPRNPGIKDSPGIAIPKQ